PPTIPAGASWALNSNGTSAIGLVGDSVMTIRLADLTPAAPRVTAANSPAVRPDAAPDTSVVPPSGVPQVRTEAAAAFTEDGRWFVARGPDAHADVWDLATGNHMPFRLEAPAMRTGPIRVVTVSDTDPSHWHAIKIEGDGTPLERGFVSSTSYMSD